MITQEVTLSDLTLHPTKTKIVDSRVESFAFPGYSFRGGMIYPRRESLAKMGRYSLREAHFRFAQSVSGNY